MGVYTRLGKIILLALLWKLGKRDDHIRSEDASTRNFHSESKRNYNSRCTSFDCVLSQLEKLGRSADAQCAQCHLFEDTIVFYLIFVRLYGIITADIALRNISRGNSSACAALRSGRVAQPPCPLCPRWTWWSSIWWSYRACHPSPSSDTTKAGACCLHSHWSSRTCRTSPANHVSTFESHSSKAISCICAAKYHHCIAYCAQLVLLSEISILSRPKYIYVNYFLTIGKGANLLARSWLLSVELITGKRENPQSCRVAREIIKRIASRRFAANGFLFRENYLRARRTRRKARSALCNLSPWGRISTPRLRLCTRGPYTWMKKKKSVVESFFFFLLEDAKDVW